MAAMAAASAARAALVVGSMARTILRGWIAARCGSSRSPRTSTWTGSWSACCAPPGPPSTPATAPSACRTAGVAIANARLYQQAQQLATVEERGRVARELHDSVSQRLFSMVYEARAAALRAADPESRLALSGLEASASAALREMKGLVYAVRPKSLERDGLEAT